MKSKISLKNPYPYHSSKAEVSGPGVMRTLRRFMLVRHVGLIILLLLAVGMAFQLPRSARRSTGIANQSLTASSKTFPGPFSTKPQVSEPAALSTASNIALDAEIPH
jgi:hypothetical protein